MSLFFARVSVNYRHARYVNHYGDRWDALRLAVAFARWGMPP